VRVEIKSKDENKAEKKTEKVLEEVKMHLEAPEGSLK